MYRVGKNLLDFQIPLRDTEVASEPWETGVLTPWFSDVSGVSFSGAFLFVRSRVYSITGDNTNIDIFVLALAVSAGCLGTVVTVKRKRK